MAGITTHVLDTAKGRPAAGMKIRLEVLRSTWETIGQGITDADGRLRSLAEGVPLERALYRLTFATGDYHKGFFPEVSIVFKVDDPAQHYHVPLLLSPFGYSTYRGS
jgi:5-hydroxyisourate hydrolase